MTSIMVTMVHCFDPFKLQKYLGFQVTAASEIEPLMTLVFNSPHEAGAFYYVHCWAVKNMNMDLDLDRNLIHVRNLDEMKLCGIVGYFFMFYRQISNQYQLIDGIVYSSITWSDIPIRI